MIVEKSISRIKEISLNVTMSKIDSIRKKDITKTGVRVYKDGYVGFSGGIGNVDIDELEKKAIASLDDKFPYKYELGKDIKKCEDYSHILCIDDAVKEFDEVMSILEKEQPEFIFSNKINISEIEYSLSNSQNLDLKYKDKYLVFSIIVKEKTSLNIIDTGIEFVTRNYNRQLLLNYVNKICNAYKNKIDINTYIDYKEGNKYPVIFRSNEGIIFNKFIKDLHGRMFASKNSLLSDKLNQKVFCEDFTLYQCNNPIKQPECFFDDEGVINEGYEYALIENGVIKSPYTDKKTSQKYNLPLTGSANCDYDSVPKLGIPSFRIKESEKTIKELLHGGIGILIDMSMGGDFSSDGNFATPVQVAYLFDGEKLLGRIPEVNISSNILDMFGKDFIGVSGDCVNELANDKYVVMNMNVSTL